jgi:glycosyltransferase involved in cell wall biosynthesis
VRLYRLRPASELTCIQSPSTTNYAEIVSASTGAIPTFAIASRGRAGTARQLNADLRGDGKKLAALNRSSGAQSGASSRIEDRTAKPPSAVQRLDSPLQSILTDSRKAAADTPVELTILLPCLNEAETVSLCVQKAVSFLLLHNVNGEVLVADNGSTDGSPALARAAGARIVHVPEPGYGSALMAGIKAARGRFVIMGDADDSYDLTALMPFLTRLREGADLVMGNRFKGGIAPGAMPRLHRYLGNPVLSFIGRLFFHSKIRDFHCGLRGFNRSRIIDVGLQATGMEFASEMVVRATLSGYRVEQVPTTLSPDGRSRAPHLRSWRDGWRHLRFLLLFSPRWLFFYPGLAMMLIGAATGLAILVGPIRFDGVKLNLATLAVACALVVIGFQAVLFAIFTAVYAGNEGFLPPNNTLGRFLRSWTLERGLAAAAILLLAGLGGGAFALAVWAGNSHYNILRIILPSLTALMVSCQLVFSAFFISILGVSHSGRSEAADFADVGTEAGSALSETDLISELPGRATRR